MLGCGYRFRIDPNLLYWSLHECESTFWEEIEPAGGWVNQEHHESDLLDVHAPFWVELHNIFSGIFWVDPGIEGYYLLTLETETSKT